AYGSLDDAELEQVGLVDIFDRVRLLAKSHRERGETDRVALELLDDRPEQRAVRALQPVAVDLHQLQRLTRDLERDLPLVADLGDITDTPQDPACDPRGFSC